MCSSDLERERMFEGALSTEEDMRVVLGYTYGKFMFNSRYERRRDISEFDTREYNVFAVTLIRNFGNE